MNSGQSTWTRCAASTVFTAFHAYGGGTRGLAYGGTVVAKDIEVYAHYGHEGVNYQVVGS
jgi:hypothetical protein